MTIDTYGNATYHGTAGPAFKVYSLPELAKRWRHDGDQLVVGQPQLDDVGSRLPIIVPDDADADDVPMEISDDESDAPMDDADKDEEVVDAPAILDDVDLDSAPMDWEAPDSM